MKYISISHIWVIDEIRAGKTIYALDRAEETIDVVNEMSVCDAVSLIKDAEKHSDRFDFWYKEENEVNEDETV